MDWQRSPARKTLMSIAALCAVMAMTFPWVTISSRPSCNCAAETQPATVQSPSCCQSEVTESCCSTKQRGETKVAGGCCCNPKATQCQCGDCECGAPPTAPIPKTPVHGGLQFQLVFAGFIGLPPGSDLDFRQLGGDHLCMASTRFGPSLSAQQKCVILSRFNC